MLLCFLKPPRMWEFVLATIKIKTDLSTWGWYTAVTNILKDVKVALELVSPFWRALSKKSLDRLDHTVSRNADVNDSDSEDWEGSEGHGIENIDYGRLLVEIWT